MSDDPSVIMTEGNGEAIEDLVEALDSVGWEMGVDFDVDGGGGYMVLDDVTLVLRASNRPEDNA